MRRVCGRARGARQHVASAVRPPDPWHAARVPPRFDASGLRDAARAVAAQALAAGALQPIATELATIDASGVAFQIRVVDSLRRKRVGSATAGPRLANPFLPYEAALFVADVPPAHVALLNKFPVIDEHLLIVTRAFVDQEAPLDPADHDAAAACLHGLDGLVFYNAGAIAGASQPHRHLQWVPALGPGAARAPLEAAIEAALDGDRPVQLPALPFAHAAIRLDRGTLATTDGGAHLAAQHARLRATLGPAGASPTYNLIATRDWLLHVPRVASGTGGVEVNALGFAGSLLVRDRDQLERARQLGPLTILAAVAPPLTAR